MLLGSLLSGVSTPHSTLLRFFSVSHATPLNEQSSSFDFYSDCVCVFVAHTLSEFLDHRSEGADSTARYQIPSIPRHDFLRGRAHPRTDTPCAFSEPSYQDLTWGTSVDGPVHILSPTHLPTGGAIGTGARRLFGKVAFRGVVRGGESVKYNVETSAVAYKLVCGANPPKRVRNHGSIPRMTGVEDHDDLLKVAGERWLGHEKSVFRKGNMSFATLQVISKDSNGGLEDDQVKVIL